jgi:ATP-dependent Clp protease protease subunit
MLMRNYDLLKFLENNRSEIKGFGDVLHLSNNLSRRLDIGDIDDEIGDAVDNIIRFWNRVDDEANIPVEKREPIKLYINSNGGALTGGLKIIDAIQLSKTPVYTINTGMAYSAGFFIFITGKERFAYPNSSFLFHEGSISMGVSDAGKFRNYANFYEKLLVKLKDITLGNTKMTEDDYEAHKKDDRWFLADEALELGICDKIITEFC